MKEGVKQDAPEEMGVPGGWTQGYPKNGAWATASCRDKKNPSLTACQPLGKKEKIKWRKTNFREIRIEKKKEGIKGKKI